MEKDYFDNRSKKFILDSKRSKKIVGSKKLSNADFLKAENFLLSRVKI